MGSLYAGEEVTAVGQQGDWLHLRLYEFDDEEEDEDEDRDDDNDVRLIGVIGVRFPLSSLPRAFSPRETLICVSLIIRVPISVLVPFRACGATVDACAVDTVMMPGAGG